MSFARRVARSCQCRAAAVAKIPTDPFSPEFALEQAKRGDPLYLSIRVLAGDELSDGERLFISDLLNAGAGKLYKTRKRQVEQWRMAKQVVALRKAGMKQKAAIDEVMRQHDCKRRTVLYALKRFKDFVVKRMEAATAKQYLR